MPKQARFHRAFVAAVVFLIGAAAASAQCSSSSTDPYLDCAKQTYQTLQKDIDGSNNYWQIGNVVDTMFDFLAMPALSPSDFNRFNQMPGSLNFCSSARTFAPYVACRYPVNAQLAGGCWYDDYGWWGIAGSKAFDSRYARIFEASGIRTAFQKIATNNWELMRVGKGDGIHKGAPQGWTNRDNLVGFDPKPTPIPDQLTPPRFQGGVWQYDLFTNARSNGDNRVPNWKGPLECTGQTMNPKTTALGPYQDTVVNGLYFTLAQRLLPHDPFHKDEYLAAIRDMYTFLRSWFGYDQGYMLPKTPGAQCPAGCDNVTALLNISQRSGSPWPGLVYERVSTYAAPDGSTAPYPAVENWSSKTFWTGDQGLLLGGLVDYARFSPNDRMSRDVAAMLLKGVTTRMVGNDGGVVPWLSADGNAPGNDPGDYESGNGIFMRYLLYANSVQTAANPVPTMVKSPEFQSFLRKAADAAYCDYQQYDSMFGHFNALATMVTARQLLTSPPTSVTCQ